MTSDLAGGGEKIASPFARLACVAVHAYRSGATRHGHARRMGGAGDELRAHAIANWIPKVFNRPVTGLARPEWLGLCSRAVSHSWSVLLVLRKQQLSLVGGGSEVPPPLRLSGPLVSRLSRLVSHK
jgi:hypothetical protein